MKPLMLRLLMLCICLSTVSGWAAPMKSTPLAPVKVGGEKKAQGTEAILSFQTWKNQQTMKAQNRVVRLANKILLSKTKEAKDVNTEFALNGDHIVDKAAPLESLGKSLRRAQQDLQIAQELEFEDYLSVYLVQLGQDEDKLKALADKLTTEQVAKTLLYLQRYKTHKQSTRPSQPGFDVE